MQNSELQDSGTVPSGEFPEFEPKNAESLATVLTQGLQSSDSLLVDRYLNLLVLFRETCWPPQASARAVK